VDELERPFEFMMNALRLNDGVTRTLFVERSGMDDGSIAVAMRTARTRGWIAEDPERIVPTELGRRFLNDVIGLFLRDPTPATKLLPASG
jgi:oxygen-independent coproporphyrinogen-3 oxidase